MNLYNCFARYDADNRLEDLVMIAEKFSFAALFLNCFFALWFLYHRMWREVLCLSIALLCIGLLSRILFHYDSYYIEASFYLIAALNCKTWLGEHLIRNKNYKLIAMVFANSKEEAKIKAIYNLLEVQTSLKVQNLIVASESDSDKLSQSNGQTGCKINLSETYQDLLAEISPKILEPKLSRSFKKKSQTIKLS